MTFFPGMAIVGWVVESPSEEILGAPSARLLSEPRVLRFAQDDIFSWDGDCWKGA